MNPGDVFRVPYPFVRCMAERYDMDGPERFLSWKPGVTYRAIYPDDSRAVAHGMGEMALTVVSIHKPGKYPERVFYTRQWTNPDGCTFGKTGLRIATKEKFKRLAARFWTYDDDGYEIEEPAPGEIA